MVVSLKPKDWYQVFVQSYLNFENLGEAVSTSNSCAKVGLERMMSGLQKKRKSNRKIDGLQENVLESVRGKKDVYICSSVQSTHGAPSPT